MRRASSRVGSLAAEKLPILLELDKGVGKARRYHEWPFCVASSALHVKVG